MGIHKLTRKRKYAESLWKGIGTDVSNQKRAQKLRLVHDNQVFITDCTLGGARHVSIAIKPVTLQQNHHNPPNARDFSDFSIKSYWFLWHPVCIISQRAMYSYPDKLQCPHFSVYRMWTSFSLYTECGLSFSALKNKNKQDQFLK